MDTCTLAYTIDLDSISSSTIMKQDNMDKKDMLTNLDLSALNDEAIRIIDVKFNMPLSITIELYDYIDRTRMVDAVSYRMSELSLTHRIMYATNNGDIYVTESKDGSTNIGLDIMEAINKFKKYWKHRMI